MDWINDQFELQKKIVQRMIDLGMTPILPCFSGGVPRSFKSAFRKALIVKNPTWQKFPDQYTSVSILSSLDPLYELMQTKFISKQTAAYGSITHFYALDQYNENDPTSGDLKYLRNVSHGAWKALKAADPNAIVRALNVLFWKDPSSFF